MSFSNLAKIYKLINEDNLYYIGSTKQDLNNRLSGHAYSKNNYLSSTKLFQNNKKVKIELLEEFEYNSKKDILIKEKYYIQKHINNDNCVNKTIPYITDLIYSDNVNQYAREYSKQWYKNNKEKRKLYQKEYNIKNNYKIKEYQKEYQKEYRRLQKIKKNLEIKA
tara:strand:+ start:220 stop:714 length:495 start_codon:yes stop_codon:yes gene_type:complete